MDKIPQAEMDMREFKQNLGVAFGGLRDVITKSVPEIRNSLVERAHQLEEDIVREAEAAIREKYGLKLELNGKLSIIKP